jgi:hypothetical protein
VQRCKYIVTVLLVVLALTINVQAEAYKPFRPPAPIPLECYELPHHIQSRWVTMAIESGAGVTYYQASTNSTVFAVQVAECAGLWIVSIWRSGVFQTNFFPGINEYSGGGFTAAAARAVSYIKGITVNWRPPSTGGGVYWPYSWWQAGPDYSDGCWVDAWGNIATWNTYHARMTCQPVGPGWLPISSNGW